MIDPDQYDGFATPEELNLTPEEIEKLRKSKRELTAYATQKLRKLKAQQQTKGQAQVYLYNQFRL